MGLKSTNPIYYVFMLFEYPLVAWYFRMIIKSRRARTAINIFFFAFPVFWFVTVAFIFGINSWNSYVVMVGDTFLICLCAIFLYELFTDKTLVNLKECTEFWIAAASIFYCACELPIMGILNFLTKNYETLAMQLLNVLQVLNIIMYITFIYAYLCRLKTSIMKL